MRKKSRADGEEVWEFRYYDMGNQGRRQRIATTVGAVREYPTESAVRRSTLVQAILLRINAECPAVQQTPTFGAILSRYEIEEMPERYSTQSAYRSYLKNHITPRWAETPVPMVKPMAVEHWLKELKLAPKTRAHIRSLMHTVFECARRWELADKNPMELVRVRGGSKRRKAPLVLTPEQFRDLLPHFCEPYRTMVLVAGCLGLRVSEVMALQWGDFDFDKRTLLVQRSIVHGRVDWVKTEVSADFVPLDPRLAEALLDHRNCSCPTQEGWVFANPVTGRPFHQEEIQKNHLRKAGEATGAGSIGWHTFRHSYRAWLDDNGAPMSVQKELMRHASIQTTMNVYGKAMTETKREANSKVVRMVLPRERSGRAEMDVPAAIGV